jgi:hypothetical protein
LAANLVTNGSFEATSQSNGTWANYSSLPGWTSGSLGIELRNNVEGAAQDGVKYVELDTTGNSFIEQTIHGTGLVELSFYYSARPNTSTSTNDLTFSLGGFSDTVLHGVGNSTSLHSWQHYTGQVDLGTSGSAVLRFDAAGTSDRVGGSLDNISVTAVPEPETYAMLLAGLGLMGAIARRRRANQA